MQTTQFFGGGSNNYLSPTIEINDFIVERGFEASLPGISTEEGEGWTEY